MNKVLVPVDFSDTSFNALLYALRLFKHSGLEITVLNTFDVNSSAFAMKSMDRIMREDAEREMEKLVKKVQKIEPDAVLQTKVIKGGAVSAITSMGNSPEYDYVVMGTKGASGLKEVFIGSVAGAVISRIKAPVLVVPDGYVFEPVKEFVLAVSGIPLSGAAVVEPLRRLVKILSCRLNILHITEGKKLDLDHMLETIDDLDPSVTYAFGTSNINQYLNEYLMSDKHRLLCLIRGSKGFFSRLFDESVTLKQTFNSPVPLLVLQN